MRRKKEGKWPREKTKGSRYAVLAGACCSDFEGCFRASAAEHVRRKGSPLVEDEKDFFDRLPDPLPHFDIGDIKYFDGRFRYF